jgi:hypothetical protein
MAVYSNSITSGTYLYAGDYITSPDGLYYAFLDTTGAAAGTPGLFVVAAGSNPTLDPVTPGCNNCYYPVTTTPGANLGGYWAQLGTNGVINVYTSASGTNQGLSQLVSQSGPPQSPSQPPYYATIQAQPGNNNSGGSFIVYQGTPPNTSNPTSTYNQNIVGSVTSIKLSGGASGDGITYDFADAKIDKILDVAGQSVQQTNYTSQTQQYNMNLTLGYTKTSSFSFQTSSTTAEQIGSSVNVGVPGVAGSTLSFSVTSSTSVSHGQATTTSTSTTFQAGARPYVPPGYTYEGYITGEDVQFDVPFTWTGTAYYAGGATAQIDGTGDYTGDDTGLFHVYVYCVSAPVYEPACPALPIIDTAVQVPEPSGAMILPLALLAAAVVRRMRGRHLRPRTA